MAESPYQNGLQRKPASNQPRWKQLCALASVEQDDEKLIMLAQQIVRDFEQEEKRKGNGGGVPRR